MKQRSITLPDINIPSVIKSVSYVFVCTVEPVLSGPVLSGHPLLSGQLSKSRKITSLIYCNSDLY